MQECYVTRRRMNPDVTDKPLHEKLNLNLNLNLNEIQILYQIQIFILLIA